MATSPGSYSKLNSESSQDIFITTLTWQTGDLWTGETLLLAERSEGGAAWREFQPRLHIDDEDVFDLVLVEEGGGGDEGVQGGVGDDDNGGPGVLQLSPDDLRGEARVGDTDPGPAQPGTEDGPVEVQPGVVGGVEDIAWSQSQLVEAATHPPDKEVESSLHLITTNLLMPSM